MTSTSMTRILSGAVALSAVVTLGSACSSDGGGAPAGKTAGPAIADPRAGTLVQAPAPSLPPRSPEFPPEGKTLEQLQLEGKVDVLRK